MNVAQKDQIGAALRDRYLKALSAINLLEMELQRPHALLVRLVQDYNAAKARAWPWVARALEELNALRQEAQDFAQREGARLEGTAAADDVVNDWQAVVLEPFVLTEPPNVKVPAPVLFDELTEGIDDASMDWEELPC